MPSLTYSTFAVAGAGGLGALVAEELLKQRATVFVLTRGDHSKVPTGATGRKVDYGREESLVDALKDVDVVVSALSQGGFAVQPALADAAKKAGVKLFVPSEFGIKTHEIPEGLLSFKAALHKHLESIGLPYTRYNVSFFSDFQLGPFFGFDLEKKKASLVGNGSAKWAATTRPDVAHFVAHTVTHLPKAQLEGAVLSVVGSLTSWDEVIAVLEKKYGAKFAVEYRDVATTEKEVAEKGFAAFGDYLQLLFLAGYGNMKSDNDLVPGWKPLTFQEAVEKYY
ncbi:NAD(P)-binding protein [Exidia glandulosa HHB12029]|uniref:NAD(P)-binding protein n=1 Tax=Exidia glandulosa HHB12029 TaxID=1314781 RepID=A0A165GSC0_EXIGL|nr:NAD(P)-binding protein [Exidia glandulosa HHB12029]